MSCTRNQIRNMDDYAWWVGTSTAEDGDSGRTAKLAAFAYSRGFKLKWGAQSRACTGATP